LSTHEDFSRREALQGPSDRSFGWVFAAFFTLVAVWPVVRGRPGRPWALAMSAVFLLITATRPSLLHPANRAWMAIGGLIGKVTNPIVTALLFFFVFTPLAVVLRLMGKDPLRLRRDGEAASYWIERQPPGPKPETMSQQF
jgi:hypothetical protein